MTLFRNDKDPDFIEAANRGMTALREFVIWANIVLLKDNSSPVYKYWMSLAKDFEYEKATALKYVSALQTAIDALKEPDKSSPEERSNQRTFISQCRSWSIAWDKGANQRNLIMDGNTNQTLIPPEEKDWLPVVWPSIITQTLVPPEITPGYDPFKDNQ